MNIPSFFLLLSSSINLILFFFLLKKKLKKKFNIFFLLFTLFVAIWCIGIFFFRAASDTYTILIWAKIIYVSTTIAALLFFLFAVYFPADKKNIKSVYILILASLSIPILIFILNNSVIERAGMQNGTNILIYGMGNIAYSLYIVACFLFGFISLYAKYRRYTEIYKLQLLYIFWGVFISLNISLFTNIILTSQGNFNYNWVGPSSTLIMVGCIYYAMLRHRLLGIRLILSNIFIYFILYLFIVATYYYSIWTQESIFGSVWEPESFLIGSLVAIIFAFLFIRLLKKSEKISDNLFYHGINPKRIINNLIIELNKTIKLKEVLKILDKNLKKIFEIEEIKVILFEEGEEGKICVPVLGALPSKQKNALSQFCAKITNAKQVISQNEIQKTDPKLYKALAKYNIKLILPLISSDKTIGVIFASAKENQEAYTQDEINFLEIISSQTSIAIENALLHEKLKNYNQNLSNQVQKQTRQIQTKNKALEDLLVEKNNFLNVINHQLNTPISIIRNALSMEGDKNFSPGQIFELAKAGLNRLSSTVNNFWQAFDLDEDGKIKSDPKPTNILNIAENLIVEKKSLKEAQGLDLKIKKPRFEAPLIFCDGEQITQALSNILDNALWYTDKGKVIISFKKAKEDNKHYLQILITDTGAGIPKKDISKIFHKFNRGSRGISLHPDGSGLGLYISQKLIEINQGKIKVAASKLGKGSAFAISLPIYIGSKSPLEIANTPESIARNIKNLKNRPLRILFVEDEKDLILIYKTYFTHHGFKFFDTSDIQKAFEIIEKKRIDLVLLDIVIPEKQADGTYQAFSQAGYKFLEKIKKTPILKKIQVIVFTSLSSEKDRKKALKLGADGYIFKGDAEPDNVLREINKVIFG